MQTELDTPTTATNIFVYIVDCTKRA